MKTTANIQIFRFFKITSSIVLRSIVLWHELEITTGIACQDILQVIHLNFNLGISMK